MADHSFAAPARSILLLCGEPRLRRILRLALESSGYTVLDVADPTAAPSLAQAVAAVVDLDSLHRCAPVVQRAGMQGVPNELPALFISVYPAEPERLIRPGPTDYLQPPFPTDEVVRCLGGLLGSNGHAAAAAGRRKPRTR